MRESIWEQRHHKKIRATNLEKYGVEVPTQNPEIYKKLEQTNIDKYGVANPGVIYSKTHTRELSPKWKGGAVKEPRTDRGLPIYREWRKKVFARDHYTCQCCGAKNGNGIEIYLEVHHMNNYKDFVDERFDINNGVTLCRQCHKDFHSQYGIKNNTKEQFYEFINNKDKKVC